MLVPPDGLLGEEILPAEILNGPPQGDPGVVHDDVQGLVQDTGFSSGLIVGGPEILCRAIGSKVCLERESPWG